MEYKVIFSIEFFVIDGFIWFLLKKIFKLKVATHYLLLSQLTSVAVMLCYLFANLNELFLIGLKLLSIFLICLLITNEYKKKEIIKIFGLYLILIFSIGGYYNFLKLIILSLNLDFCNWIGFGIVFSIAFIIFYLFIYFIFVEILSKNNLKNLLAKVSFSLSGKHICLKGLIDSGNSVYDTKTGKPVIFVSMECLKKYFPLLSLSFIIDVLAENVEKCVLVGGDVLYVPIVSVDECKIIKNGDSQNFDFVLGVVKQNFYDKRHYDCLLHKDFV